MIRVEALTKRYGSTLALDRLSLDVPPGSVFGLLGPNGAGKTTFLRLLMGFLFPDAGQIDRRHKSQVLRMLLDAGVDVRQLTEQRAMLEEIYLRATDE